MERDVMQLLDMLFDLINNAKGVPLNSEKCILDLDAALDLLDEVREQLPLELKKAKELLSAKEEFINGAKRDVERMLRQAELDAKTIVSESETMIQARNKAAEIVRRAEDRSKEMYRVTNEYTEDALRRTEEAIQMALAEMQQARSSYRKASDAQMQQQINKIKQIEQDEKEKKG